MSDRQTTHECAFTFEVPSFEPEELVLKVPQAPGFQYPDPETAAYDAADEATEKKRREFSELYYALEDALSRVVDYASWYNPEDRELRNDFDQEEGYQYLRMHFQDKILWEFAFHSDGTVSFRDHPESQVSESDSTWKQGVESVLMRLRTEAELEMQAAAERLEAVRSFKVEGT